MLEEEYLEDHPGTAGTVEPFVYDDVEDIGQGQFPFPLTTDLLLSDEWEEVPDQDRWFIDSSGFGSESEPALTIPTFRRELAAYVREHPDHGFGLDGVGQFQVYVRAYRRVCPDPFNLGYNE